jgi:hypothetical protein
MSAIDEMEERNQHAAYQHGFKEGARQERERVLKLIKSRSSKEIEDFVDAVIKEPDKMMVCPNPRNAPVCKDCCPARKPHKIDSGCFSECAFGQMCIPVKSPCQSQSTGGERG